MLSRQEPRKHLGQSSHPGFWSPRLSRVSRDLPVRSEGAPWSLTARFHCTCICFTHRSSAQVQVCLHHCSGSRLSAKFVKDWNRQEYYCFLSVVVSPENTSRVIRFRRGWHLSSLFLFPLPFCNSGETEVNLWRSCK